MIFVPGQPWLSHADVVWDGPYILTLKRRLKPTYGHLRKLFNTHLAIHSAADDVVGDELLRFSSTHRGSSLGNTAIARLRQLLLFGSDTMERVSKRELPDWATKVLEQDILPIRAAAEDKVLLASMKSRSFYVPDPSGVLANIFKDHVSFIDLDPGLIIRMDPLLVRFGLEERRIDKFVSQSVACADGSLADIAATANFRNSGETAYYQRRLPYLERYGL